MDPITISHQARLRHQEILEETGIVRKHDDTRSSSFGIWRWVRKTIQSTIRVVIQPVQKQKRTERQLCHDPSAHPEAVLK